MKAAAERDARVRLQGNKNLVAAALQTGVRRILVQSTGFWYGPGDGLASESEPFAVGASPAIAAGSQRYADLEAMVFGRAKSEAVALRYGFFYETGTWFTSDGDVWENKCGGSKYPSSGMAREFTAGYTLTMRPTVPSWPWTARPAPITSSMTIPASSACGCRHLLAIAEPPSRRTSLNNRPCTQQDPMPSTTPPASEAPRTRRPNASLASILVRFHGWLIQRGQLTDNRCLWA